MPEEIILQTLLTNHGPARKIPFLDKMGVYFKAEESKTLPGAYPSMLQTPQRLRQFNAEYSAGQISVMLVTNMQVLRPTALAGHLSSPGVLKGQAPVDEVEEAPEAAQTGAEAAEPSLGTIVGKPVRDNERWGVDAAPVDATPQNTIAIGMEDGMPEQPKPMHMFKEDAPTGAEAQDPLIAAMTETEATTDATDDAQEAPGTSSEDSADAAGDDREGRNSSNQEGSSEGSGSEAPEASGEATPAGVKKNAKVKKGSGRRQAAATT